MQNLPLFSAMTSEQREAWLTEYSQWLSVDYPKVEDAKSLTSLVRTTAEKGLRLLAAFPYCRSFVRESLAVKDYHRRMKVMRRYVDKVTAEIQKDQMAVVDLTNPELLKPHVGRPTREEKAAKQLQQQKQREQEDKNSLFNQQTDGTDGMVQSFGPIAPSAKLPTLAELRWLMSPALQAKADTVRDLRSRAEEASTRAKQMAEDGRPAEDIEPYAQEAAQCFDKVTEIYKQVDLEMAVAYVRLKEDTAYIAEVAKVSKLDNNELRTWLRPYWDKVENKEAFKQQVIDTIKANDPAQKAAREQQEAIDNERKEIIKYLQRKDKPNSLKRIATMEIRLARLHELMGDEANVYDALLVAAKDDYQTNILPKEEAKKAARAEKKKASKKSKVKES